MPPPPLHSPHFFLCSSCRAGRPEIKILSVHRMEGDSVPSPSQTLPANFRSLANATKRPPAPSRPVSYPHTHPPSSQPDAVTRPVPTPRKSPPTARHTTASEQSTVGHLNAAQSLPPSKLPPPVRQPPAAPQSNLKRPPPPQPSRVNKLQDLGPPPSEEPPEPPSEEVSYLLLLRITYERQNCTYIYVP